MDHTYTRDTPPYETITLQQSHALCYYIKLYTIHVCTFMYIAVCTRKRIVVYMYVYIIFCCSLMFGEYTYSRRYARGAMTACTICHYNLINDSVSFFAYVQHIYINISARVTVRAVVHCITYYVQIILLPCNFQSRRMPNENSPTLRHIKCLNRYDINVISIVPTHKSQ